MYEEELDYEAEEDAAINIEEPKTPVFDPPPGHPLKPIEVQDDSPEREPFPWLCRRYFEASKSSSGDAASATKPDGDSDKLSSFNEDDSYDTIYKTLLDNEVKLQKKHSNYIARRDKYGSVRAEARVLLGLRNDYRKAHQSLLMAHERFRSQLKPFLERLDSIDERVKEVSETLETETRKRLRAQEDVKRLTKEKERIILLKSEDITNEYKYKAETRKARLINLKNKHGNLKEEHKTLLEENTALKKKVKELEALLTQINKEESKTDENIVCV